MLSATHLSLPNIPSPPVPPFQPHAVPDSSYFLPLPLNILCLRIVRKNRIEYYITSSSQDFLAETRGRCCERRNLEVCRGVFASYYHGVIYSIIFYLMLKSKRIYTLSQHINLCDSVYQNPTFESTFLGIPLLPVKFPVCVVKSPNCVRLLIRPSRNSSWRYAALGAYWGTTGKKGWLF